METHAFGFRLRADAPEGQKRFPISHLSVIFGFEANMGEELIERVHHEVRDVLVELVQKAAVTPDLAKSNTGPALEWHRMSENDMRAAVYEVVSDIRGTEPGNLKPTKTSG
jgi:hypothetical protein